MEMLRRNLKRQASRSLSAFAVSSPRSAAAAADQENLHPNLAAASPPMSPAKNSSAPDVSPRLKPIPTGTAAGPPPTAAAEEERATMAAAAPADDEPSVKVVVRVRPTPAGRRQGSVVRAQDLPGIQGMQVNSPEKQTSYQCRCSFLEN